MRFYPFGSGSFIPTFQVTASRADYALSASSAILGRSASVALNGSQGEPGPDGACNLLDNGPPGISRAGDDNYKGPNGTNGSVVYQNLP